MFTTVFAGRSIAFDMRTTKSTTIAVRVPVEIADAVRQDAEGLGLSPGGLLRHLLEARYSVRSVVRTSEFIMRKPHDDEYVRFAE